MHLLAFITEASSRVCRRSSFICGRGTGEIFSILFVDIDNLKKINDEYGHLSGDEALKKIGQCIKLYLRKADIGVQIRR